MSIIQTRRQRVQAGTGITVSHAGSSDTVAIDAAVQADQETASSTAKVVVPGVQQFHPSAAKWWGYATVSTNVPTLQASYNVTSITDTATGQITWTIATDMSSVNWAPWVAVFNPTNQASTYGGTPAAGSLLQNCVRVDTGALLDPGAWSAGGFGDQ